MINGHHRKTLMATMREAHAFVRDGLPADNFKEQMENFAGAIRKAAADSKTTPLKAAIGLAKMATDKGDDVVAYKVYAAFIEHFETGEPDEVTVQ